MAGPEHSEGAQAPWRSEELPLPTRDLAKLRGDLDRFGYCVIARALEGGLLRAVQERLFQQAAAERERHNMKNPANTDPVNQWVGMLLNKGDVFFELVRHEIYTALVEHLIGPHYLISCVDAQIQHPGAGPMPLHTDQWWMPEPVVPGTAQRPVSELARGTGTGLDPSPALQPIAPAVAVNAMWMVSAFTEENGATRIVPGSHLSARQPDPSLPHKVPSLPVTGPAGTAFVFDARLWHAAAPNRSNESRYGLTTVCCGPQFRPLENYSRGLRPEVFGRCPREVLGRLGLATWSSYGHTGDPEAEITEDGTRAMGELRDD